MYSHGFLKKILLDIGRIEFGYMTQTILMIWFVFTKNLTNMLQIIEFKIMFEYVKLYL